MTRTLAQWIEAGTLTDERALAAALDLPTTRAGLDRHSARVKAAMTHRVTVTGARVVHPADDGAVIRWA